MSTAAWTAIFVAAGYGHAGIVSALLAAKADPTVVTADDGSTPLFAACMTGHTDVATMLLAAGADADAGRQKDGMTPLGIAAIGGNMGLVTLLLAHGVSAFTFCVVCPCVRCGRSVLPCVAGSRLDDPCSIPSNRLHRQSFCRYMYANE
jgi:ankyrin repeat protein